MLHPALDLVRCLCRACPLVGVVGCCREGLWLLFLEGAGFCREGLCVEVVVSAVCAPAQRGASSSCYQSDKKVDHTSCVARATHAQVCKLPRCGSAAACAFSCIHNSSERQCATRTHTYTRVSPLNHISLCCRGVFGARG
jgi:hypothetical protein